MNKGDSGPGSPETNISASGAAGEGGTEANFPACRDFDIRIARNGSWYYRGSVIGRKSLVQLFSSVIERDDDGVFWLVTPVERGRITVDDAPFTAIELDVIGDGDNRVLRFRNNVDTWIEAGPEHPIRVEVAPETGEPSPYILVRDRLEALIVRSVFYQLVDLAVEGRGGDSGQLGVWSKGRFFPLGQIA